jgi:hypothetical protein
MRFLSARSWISPICSILEIRPGARLGLRDKAARVTAWCGRRFWQIFLDRARRHAEAEFQQQLVCNSFLAPRGVLTSHLEEQTELPRNPRPARLAFSTPEKLEAFAAPTDEGLGRHDRQCASPIEPAAEPQESQAGWMGDPSGFDFALLVERELFAQQEILGRERAFARTRADFERFSEKSEN